MGSINPQKIESAFSFLAKKELSTSKRWKTQFPTSEVRAVNELITTLRKEGEFSTSEKEIIANIGSGLGGDKVNQLVQNLDFIKSSSGTPLNEDKVEYVQRRLLHLENKSNHFFNLLDSMEWIEDEGKINDLYDSFVANIPKPQECFQSYIQKLYSKDNDSLEKQSETFKMYKELESRLKPVHMAPLTFMLFCIEKQNTERRGEHLEKALQNFQSYLNSQHKDLDTDKYDFQTSEEFFKVCKDYMTMWNKQLKYDAIDGKLGENKQTKTFKKEISKAMGEKKQEGLEVKLAETYEAKIGGVTSEGHSHRPEGEYRKLEKSKASKKESVPSNPIIEHAAKQLDYVKQLKMYYKQNKNKKWLFEPTQLKTDASGTRVVKVEISDEQRKFYEDALDKIQSLQKEKDISPKKASSAYLDDFKKQLSDLVFPSRYNGKNLEERSDYALHRGFTSHVDKQIRSDEEWLENAYNKKLSGKKFLNENSLNSLKGDIDEQDRINKEKIAGLKKRHSDFLENFKETLIPLLINTRKKEGVKCAGDLRSLCNKNQLFRELDKIESETLAKKVEQERSGASDPGLDEKLKAYQEDFSLMDDIFESLIEVLTKEEAVPEAAELVEKVSDILIGDENKVSPRFIKNTELTLYFPERLNNYLDLYHQKIMNEADLSKGA